MVNHNIVIAYRNFKKYKTSFFINVVGLSAGLASVLMIYLWVQDELAIDKFHSKDDRLYQVMSNIRFGGEMQTSDNNSDLLVPAVMEELPDVEYAVAVAGPFNSGILTAGEKSIKSTDRFAGKDFFNVFSYELIQGTQNQVLVDKYSIVISDELAVKLFGTTDNVLGKSITWDGRGFEATYFVSGVFKKPEHSSESFDFLLTNAMFLDRRPAEYKNWGSNSSRAYLILKEGVDAASFNNKIARFYHAKLDPIYGKDHPEWIGTMFITRFSDNYLHGTYENGIQSGGRIDYVILFSTIALFILIIACINFMNLSTARASRRVKEVGVKKAVGALRRTLIVQYLSESMLLVFFSLVLAILLVFLFLPQFNLITGKQLMLEATPGLVAGTLTIAILTGLISGSYPSFYLSSFRPSQILKGTLPTAVGELWARQGLVVFQFCISILLIVSVLVVYRQIQFLQNKNIGYDKEHVIVFDKQGKLNDHLETFMTQAKSIPGVIQASTFDYVMGRPSTMTGGVSWEGKSPDKKSEFGILDVDYDFIETLGFTVVAGRPFSRQFVSDKKTLVCNATAVQLMNMKDPVGKTIKLWGNEYTIIGVVKDFYFESLYEAIKPCYFRLSEENSRIAVKLERGMAGDIVARLGKLYQDFNPGVPFDYQFLDSEYRSLYLSERRVADLAGYFATIAILISCLGLFGLAAFTAERRTKEIGIRKILGSGEWSIVYMLSSSFTKMVVVAMIISLPVSYFLARQWLGNFAYRIDLEWWYFIGTGMTALLIAWLTVASQAIKAAGASPVKSLRSE